MKRHIKGSKGLNESRKIHAGPASDHPVGRQSKKHGQGLCQLSRVKKYGFAGRKFTKDSSLRIDRG